MFFEFFIVGTIFIWGIFYLKINQFEKWLFLLSNLLLIVSYFCSSLFIRQWSISINIFVFISTFFYMVFLFRLVKQIKYNEIFENVFYIVLLYVLLNMVSIEFNIFFNVVPLIMVIIAINLFNGKETYSSLIGVNISFVLIEIFNMIFMLKKLDFTALFGREFVICIVVCNIVLFGYFKMFEMIKGVKYEKSF